MNFDTPFFHLKMRFFFVDLLYRLKLLKKYSKVVK
jgi:hypothetical protein